MRGERQSVGGVASAAAGKGRGQHGVARVRVEDAAAQEEVDRAPPAP